MSAEKDLTKRFGNLKIVAKQINKIPKSVEKKKKICWFDLLRDEMMFSIFEYLSIEVVRLAVCSKKYKASVLFYGEILKRLFQDDLSVMLPRFLQNEPTLFQLNKFILRSQRQEWFLLRLDSNVNGKTKLFFGKNSFSQREITPWINRSQVNDGIEIHEVYSKDPPLYFRHCDFLMELNGLDDIEYDCQYQFIKLSNGYYKIMNPYRNGYCVSNELVIVPNRNDYLDEISWIIEPKEDNLIVLKSVKTGKYISVKTNTFTHKAVMSSNPNCYALFEVTYSKYYSTIPEIFKDYFSGYSKVSWENEINSFNSLNALLMENSHHF